ncbi:MAG: hypothetical protein FWG63_11505 [Defluviitaleaceae bacterium]|nr:hypothetical protein [Defluviitaleaceae bacterium]
MQELLNQGFESKDFLDVFCLLIVQTVENDIVLRPIGGNFGLGINDAIEEMDRLYPNCKMKILEENCCAFQDYFFGNGISFERML